MVEEVLVFEGFAVRGASNGREGLDALREHRPCLILLDLSMPVMDGWRFREEQLRLPDAGLAAVPVVVVSALSHCERDAHRIGAVDCIPKPIDFDRMLTVVRQYCGAREG